MRVGILTWHSACNYGARAHSLALRKTVESLGYECEMIDFHPKNERRVNYRANVGVNHIYLHPRRMLKAYIRCKKFEKALSLNPISRQVYTSSDIDELGLNVIILGSDEIFNVGHPTFNPVYYGVGISKTPLITYAPSSGQYNTNEILPSNIRESLKRIIALSVRDQYTADLIKNNTGREALIVSDPTILYSFNQESIKPRWSKYLMIYAFDSWKEYKTKICQYAHDNGMKVLSLGQYRAWADINYDLASIQEWFGAFKYAECVITDSFHGTVFATKFHKQFVLLGRLDKLNKINDFLDNAGIDRQFYDASIDLHEYFDKKIDFELTDKRLNLIKEKSLDYLREALQKAIRMSQI